MYSVPANTPLTLGNLPPDIVRALIKKSDLVEDIRLISPAWNALVIDYLSRPCLGTLERVYLFTCSPTGQPDTETNGVHMTTIVPERVARNVGVGQWLSVHKTYLGPAIEAKCEHLHSKVVPSFASWMSSSYTFLACMMISIFVTVTLFAIECPVVGLNLLGALLLPVIYYAFLPEQIKVQDTRHFPLLSRFFSMFSAIDVLVLQDSKIVHNKDDFGALQTSLGDVRINRLEIAERFVNEDLLNKIIQLCRRHDVRHVFLTASVFQMNRLCDFVLQLAAMDVTLDLYENGEDDHSRTLALFGECHLFWDKTIKTLKDAQISLRKISTRDAGGNWEAYRYAARAHVRCERVVDDEKALPPMEPVGRTRGYRLRPAY